MKTNIEKITLSNGTVVYAAKRGIAPVCEVLVHDWDSAWYEPCFGDVYQGLDGNWYIQMLNEEMGGSNRIKRFEPIADWQMRDFERNYQNPKRSRRSRIAWAKAQKRRWDNLPF